MTGQGPVIDGVVDFGLVLGRSRDSADFLQQLLDTVVEQTPGAEACGLTLERAGRGETVVHSGELARVGDERQYQLDQGPCLQSLRDGVVVTVEDMAAETRWGDYPGKAVAAGVRATLSLPLVVGSVARGALNLYAREPGAFTETDRVAATTWAGQASGALSVALRLEDHADHARDLERALASRTVIAQATGLLMAQARCTAEVAFQALTRESQHTNRKVRAVAADLIARHEAGLPPRR